MQSSNLIARPDTFFGVCEGLSEDLGIHANFFRIAFAGLFFWNPLAALGAYAATGAVVALSRFLFPNPRAAAAPAERPAKAEPAPQLGTAEAEEERVPLAA